MKSVESIKQKGSSDGSSLTMWYLKFWTKALSSEYVPRRILKDFLQRQFVGLKYASPRSRKALAWVSDSALAKISSMFLVFPLCKLSPILVNMGFFFDRMIEYSKAVSLPVNRGEVFLDIGSGYSIFPSYLASYSCVVSVDVERAIATFQKKASETMGKSISAKMECVLADSTRLPFKDDSFDRIFAISTIEHVERDSSLAKEAGRTLKRGGYCFMSFPFSRSQKKPMISPYFQRFYTREMMLERIVIPSMLSLEEFSTVIKTSLCSFFNMVPGWFIFKDLVLFSTWFRLETALFKDREGTLALAKLIKLS